MILLSHFKQKKAHNGNYPKNAKIPFLGNFRLVLVKVLCLWIWGYCRNWCWSLCGVMWGRGRDRCRL